MKHMKTYNTNIDRIGLKKEKGDFPRAKLLNSLDSFNYVKQFYFDDISIYESFFLILLNSAHNTIGYAKISQGGIRSTIVDVKFIAKYIVDTLALHIIIIHNHPSGNRIPSEADKELTQKIKQMVTLFDSNLLDHLIITEDSYYSFADEGIL